MPSPGPGYAAADGNDSSRVVRKIYCRRVKRGT